MQKSRNTKLIVLEGVISNLLFGTLLVWSVLRNPFLALFPAWNEGMLSIIFGIHNLFTCFGLMAGGWLCSRFPTRRIYLLYMIMTIIGLVGFAFLPEAHPKLAYLMAAGFFWLAATGIGIGINVIQSTTIPWFPNNSGAISGALYMALGVSSVGLAALARFLLPRIGVKLVLPSFAVIVLVVSLLVLADKNSVLSPYAKQDTPVALHGVKPAEMLRSVMFWFLIVWNCSLRTAGLILIDHAASLAVAFGGMALVAMLIAPANGLGSLTMGIAMDKLGMRRISRLVAAVMLLAAALLILGVCAGQFLFLLLGLLLGGFSYGGSSSSYAASIKNQFGTKYYTQNFALSNLSVGIAALLESTSGTVLDISGSYLPVMVMVAVLAILAALLALIFGKLFRTEKHC